MDEYKTFIPTARKSAYAEQSSPVSTEGIELLEMAELLALCKIIEVDLSECKTREDMINALVLALRNLPNVSASSVLEAKYAEFKELSQTLADFIPHATHFYHEVLPDDTKEEEAEFIAQVEQAQRQLHDENATLVVCGDMSSGKSTLLNVLMEDAVLPTAAIRCTGAVTEIVGASDDGVPHARFYGPDPSAPHVAEEKLPRKATECQRLLERHIALEGEGGAEGVHRCVVEWDRGLVTRGIRLVDTPGLNDEERLSERVVEYLPSAVGMIVTLNCNAGGLTNTTKRLVRSAISAGLPPSSMLFVGSKIDLVEPAERATLKATIISGLRSLLGGQEPRFVALNVAGAFLGIRTYDIQTPALQRFNRLLHDFVGDSFRAKLKRAHTVLLGDRGVVTRWTKIISLRANTLRMATDEQVTLQRRVETAIRDAIIRNKSITDSLVRVLSEVEAQLTRDVKAMMSSPELSSALREHVSGRNLEGLSPTEAKTLLRNSMKQFVETFLQDHLPDKFEVYKDQVSGAINEMLKFLEGTERNLDSILLNAVPRPERGGLELQMALEIHPRLGGLEQGGIFGRIKRFFWKEKRLADATAVAALKGEELEKCLRSIPAEGNVNFIIKRVFPKEQLMERASKYFADLLDYNRRLLLVVSSIDKEGAEEAYEALTKIMGVLSTMSGWLAAFQVAHLLDWEFDYDQVKFLGKLGGGGFGSVFKVEYEGRTLAMKMAAPQPETFTSFLKEYEVLRALGKPGAPVVQYFGCTIAPKGAKDHEGAATEGWLCLLMECCDNGDLTHFVKESSPPLDACGVAELLLSAAKALKHMADRGFVHRDVKGANLLVDKDRNVKAVDFGLTSKTNLITGTTGCGTLLFMAPEMMPISIPNLGFYALPPSGPEVDVYSFGMVILEVVSGELPWQKQVNNNVDPIKFMAMVKNRMITPDIPGSCPPPCGA